MLYPAALSIAMQIIPQFEGCKLAPYQDSAGVWTIGFGATYFEDGSPVAADTPPISMDRACALLEMHVTQKAAAVDSYVTVDLTAAQRAALYSFCYNEGEGNFLKSNLLRQVNLGDFTAATAEFANWVYARDPQTKQLVRLSGLVTRRKLEAGLFSGTVKFEPKSLPSPPVASEESETDKLNDGSFAAAKHQDNA